MSIKIKDLRRAEYNPRTMPDAEMQALKQSIKAWGFVEPVVVNQHECPDCGDRKNVLVGGHQRTTAADAIGMEEVPAVYVDLHLEQEKLLNLALNKIRGKWDEDKLAVLITELRSAPELPATGFRDDEVSRILDQTMDTPELEEEGDGGGIGKEPRSKPGVIYQLGEHRLICGDATEPETFARLLEGEKADMIFTDPPYNVAYKSRGEHLKESDRESIKNDDLDDQQFAYLIDSSFARMLENAKAGASFYICSGWSSYPQFLASLGKNGFEHSGVIIWVKNVPSMGWNDYRYKREWILKAKKGEGKKAVGIIYGWKTGAPHTFHADNEFDVWEMPRKAVTKYLHPTEKPDWLAMRALRNSTKRGDIVLDPFAGSGSTMAAAEKTGRRAFMVELDPKFCDEIRDRWARMEKAKAAGGVQTH